MKHRYSVGSVVDAEELRRYRRHGLYLFVLGAFVEVTMIYVAGTSHGLVTAYRYFVAAIATAVPVGGLILLFIPKRFLPKPSIRTGKTQPEPDRHGLHDE